MEDKDDITEALRSDVQGVVLRERIIVWRAGFTLMTTVGQGARVLWRTSYSLNTVEIAVDDGDCEFTVSAAKVVLVDYTPFG